MICNKGYKTLESYECFNACLLSYLNYQGLSVNKSEIFFLGEGLETSYNKEKYLIETTVPQSNIKFLKKLNIEYKHNFIKNVDEAYIFLRNSIKKERNLIVKVSSKLLTYNSIFINSEESAHFINVIGVKDNYVYISDGYINETHTKGFEGFMSLDELLKAWGCYQYEYVILDMKNSRKNFRKCSKKLVVESSMRQIESYLNVEDGNNGYGRNSPKSLALGLKEAFLNKDIDFRKLTEKVNYRLKVYGFLQQKKYILNFIRYIDKNLILQEEKREYSDIIMEWNKISMLLLKAGIRNKESDVLKVYNKILILCEREELNLKRILGKLHKIQVD